MADTYEDLIAMLDAGGAKYRTIDHQPEGQTDAVSELRGHDVASAAKCIVLIVKQGKRKTRFVLAVVSGDARVDMRKVRGLLPGATYAGFAATDVAERLAGSVSGTVLPFSFHPDLCLIVDKGLQELPEIFFNAARLDRSIALATTDYLRLAQPQLADIVAPNQGS